MDKVRGTVVLSPGRTEPIEKYYEVIGNFLARGWCVLTHDWRGQIDVFKDMYRGRRDAMLTALEEHMPQGSTWTRPSAACVGTKCPTNNAPGTRR